MLSHHESCADVAVRVLSMYAGSIATDHRDAGRRLRVRSFPARAFSRPDAKDVVFMPNHPVPPHDNTDSHDSQEHQDSQGRTRSSLPEGYPWTLRFDDFVVYAAGQEPDKDDFSDGWHSPLWNFTRLIRSWAKEHSSGSKAFKDVNRVVMAQLGGWGYFGLDYETAHFEFIQSWKKIRWRKDETPLSQALLKAKAHPVKAPKIDGDNRATPGYDRFISFVGWLQFTRGEQNIFLPVREVARLLETDQRMISLWRQQAIDDGFLEVVAAHHYRPGSKGKATEFKVKAGFMEWFKNFLGERLK